jgi:hypothetical protein
MAKPGLTSEEVIFSEIFSWSLENACEFHIFSKFENIFKKKMTIFKNFEVPPTSKNLI